MTAAITAAMIALRRVKAFAVQVGPYALLRAGVFLAAAVFGATLQAQAQEPRPAPEARIIVVGEGSVSVVPD